MVLRHVEIPDGFAAYVGPALLRWGYLYPGVRAEVRDNTIVLESDQNLEEPAASLRHQLYRERIYQETLPIRCRLYEGLAR
ncbi:hypothetical protein [Pararhodospirillum oryzae]|uniref:Uncharacterized protein n=1 Tax=Pararhodospirillum oryzae TaxID=478448 RepID=A0A512H542_9PROT|nr:hypothetical protein [Pararhodospirillum oryzae]GEO80582.1 hypothetical protein ROR02_07130 [Pararhodospirillum oryzae]